MRCFVYTAKLEQYLVFETEILHLIRMFTLRRLQQLNYIVLLLITATGLITIIFYILYNPVRGDEALSFMHSDPGLFSPAEVWMHISSGADHSYLHTLLLNVIFRVFGYHIYVQRIFSFACWLLAAYLLYRVFAHHYRQKQAFAVAGVFALFSNLGMFLASDGRFYALTWVCALLSLSVFFNARSFTMRQCIIIVIVQLMSLLVNPQLIIWHGLLLTMCFFTTTDFREVAKAMLSVCTAAFIYALFFQISAFDTYIADTYSPELFTFRYNPSIVEWPFRWILLPDFPGVGDKADALLTCAAVLVFVYFALSRKQIRLTNPFSHLAILFISFVLLLALAITFAGIRVWETRYFTFGFYIVPFFSVALFPRAFVQKKYQWVLFALLFFQLNRVASDAYESVGRKNHWNVREQLIQSLKPGNRPLLFIEKCDSIYSPFRLAGMVYVLNADIRPHLNYCYCSSDTLRAAYFERLNSFGYRMRFIPD